MSTPHDDDPWSDLAADLGVGHTPPTNPPLPFPNSDESAADLDLLDAPADADGDVDDTQVIPALHAEPTAEGDGPGEGGKKRRRRRRRKKKGGPADAAGPAGDEEGDEDGAEEGGEEEEAVAPADEPTTEVARDVIANWNVPSWEEVVAGLYRPGGDR